MNGPLIRADMLLLVLRGELDEQRFIAKLNESKASVDDTQIAHTKGFMEGLEFCIDQVEARAKKAAAA
jgi:hypothetical protein